MTLQCSRSRKHCVLKSQQTVSPWLVLAEGAVLCVLSYFQNWLRKHSPRCPLLALTRHGAKKHLSSLAGTTSTHGGFLSHVPQLKSSVLNRCMTRAGSPAPAEIPMFGTGLDTQEVPLKSERTRNRHCQHPLPFQPSFCPLSSAFVLTVSFIFCVLVL